MTFSSWLTYVLACILLITPPGPTVTYLMTTSMTHGRKTAYAIVWGSFWGGVVCLLLSFLGVGAILQASDILYTLLRLTGVGYLIYLGMMSLLTTGKTSRSSGRLSSSEPKDVFKNSFLLIFLNPKNLIFFASFIPQFITPQGNFFLQASILSVTYLMIGLINDYLYSFFARSIGRLLGRSSDIWIAKIGGVAMILSAGLVIWQNF